MSQDNLLLLFRRLSWVYVVVTDRCLMKPVHLCSHGREVLAKDAKQGRGEAGFLRQVESQAATVSIPAGKDVVGPHPSRLGQ